MKQMVIRIIVSYSETVINELIDHSVGVPFKI